MPRFVARPWIASACDTSQVAPVTIERLASKHLEPTTAHPRRVPMPQVRCSVIMASCKRPPLVGCARAHDYSADTDRKSPQTTSKHTRCADGDALRPAAKRPPPMSMLPSCWPIAGGKSCGATNWTTLPAAGAGVAPALLPCQPRWQRCTAQAGTLVPAKSISSAFFNIFFSRATARSPQNARALRGSRPSRVWPGAGADGTSLS